MLTLASPPPTSLACIGMDHAGDVLRASGALHGGGIAERQRMAVLEVLAAGLAAADPGRAVRRRLAVDRGRVRGGEMVFSPRRVWVLGAGKASGVMAAAAEGILDDLVAGGLVIVKDGHRSPTGRVEIVEAAHPVPDARAVEATARLVEVGRTATADDLVVCLLSGGGSALLTWPAEGLSLADLQATTEILLRSGAPIHELNAVRKHLDRVKGGGLARMLGPAPVLTLALSDVVGDDLAVIASGPTAPDPTTFADACQVLDRHGLWAAVPAAVTARLRRGACGELPDTPKPGDPAFERVHHVIVGSTAQAAAAAACRAVELGLRADVLSTAQQGEARELGAHLARMGRDLRDGRGPLQPPACLILGGETTVTVRGSGRGGRNQEAALAAAIGLDGTPGVAVACLATDGGDGPTDAAGALVDGTTAARARALGLEARAFLERNDSYPFFSALGDHLVTGPTGTNVCDLSCVFAW